jgi:hypothetical protein
LELSTSKPETWQLKEFGQAYDPDGGGSNFVSIPKFQRSLVWSEDQRRMLVDSLYRGFPIGAILGYQTGLKNGKRNVVQIVDGLQRSTTIAEYLKQPLYYAPADLVFSEEFIALISKTAGFGLDKDSLAKVLLALENWLRDVKVARLGAAFNAEKLVKSVATTLDIAEELFEPVTDQVSEELGTVIERVKEVESLPIPLIMYSGDVGNIATIFERVNNQGTQLSKYEILASSWVSYQTRITNEDIRKKILAKYDVLRSRGFEIDGLPEGSGIGEDEYNLYEYLFGLGKLLAEKFDIKFCIETGTYLGGTTLRLAEMFKEVWTCEIEPEHYEIAKENIGEKNGGIEPIIIFGKSDYKSYSFFRMGGTTYGSFRNPRCSKILRY